MRLLRTEARLLSLKKSPVFQTLRPEVGGPIQRCGSYDCCSMGAQAPFCASLLYWNLWELTANIWIQTNRLPYKAVRPSEQSATKWICVYLQALPFQCYTLSCLDIRGFLLTACFLIVRGHIDRIISSKPRDSGTRFLHLSSYPHT